MQYILGASGLIGTAIREQFRDHNFSIVPRKKYLSWGVKERFKEFLITYEITESDTFYYCSGITDPSADKDDMYLVNHQVPLTILEQSLEIGYRLTTFGTILENSGVQNTYIDTKKLFLQEASKFTKLQTHRHLQLHTVYGIHPPKMHMLLGKIKFALQNNSILEMTSGMQFREYWHAHDIASFVASKELEHNRDKVIQVSSGQPIRLLELVLAIFRYFDAEHLLSIGSLLDDPNEHYDPIMFESKTISSKFMRDPIKGVIEYLGSNLKGGFNEK